MRDILFRGKRPNGKWVCGPGVIKGPGFTNIYAVVDEWLSGDKYLKNLDFVGVLENSVSEYIGLTDKNGQKIFEGDIVLAKSKYDTVPYKFIVKFGKCGGAQNVIHDVGYLGFYFEIVGPASEVYKKWGLRNDPLYWVNSYECEVIGNIYDNPELLEGGDTIATQEKRE